MWDNFIFSLTTVVPVFILILLGYLACRFGAVDKKMMDKLAGVTFRYFLSVKIALSTYDCSLRDNPGLPMMLFCTISLVAFFALIWLLAHHLLQRRESVGSFVHCSIRGSITVLGLALAHSLAGDWGVAICAPLVAVGSFENNILAVICLSHYDEGSSRRKQIWEEFKLIAKNPMILGAVVGAAAHLLRLPCPAVLRKPLEDLAVLAVPLSLLCIGASLSPESVRRSFSYALGAAVIKTFGMALLAVPAAVLLGFRGTELAIIGFFYTLANPSGCYVMTLAQGGDADLAASATLLSTVLSVFSVTLLLFLLKSFGLL